MKDVPAFLVAKTEEYSSNQELTEIWSNLHQYYIKRLWHQLTGVLLQLVKRHELADGDKLWQLYTNVISDFELKLNPLSLVEIITPIAEQMCKVDVKEVLNFLHQIAEKVKGNSEAYVMAKILIGRIHLKANDLSKTKVLLEETEPLLDEIEGVGIVHGRFYLLLSELCQKQADYKDYYRAALHFLGCTELSALSVPDQQQKAYLLALAALLGKDVYNFGELLAHPILGSLANTEQQWIVDLLNAFNSGDVERFGSMKNRWSKEQLLVDNEPILVEKIRLLALMEMAFRRASHDRQITFEDIQNKTGLGQDDVEMLVMKCLSKALVKGQIDQVAKTVDLTWVQPRVLDKQQLTTIQGKIAHLTTSITNMENMIETNAGEIITY